MMLSICMALLAYCIFTTAVPAPWDLPVFPDFLPSVPQNQVHNSTVLGTEKKRIPYNIWIAVRQSTDVMPKHLHEFLIRNKHWSVNIVSNDMKDAFMNATFANTSLLWAYHAINPICGAAKADIWRYAVLYTFGGAYIDDDSDLIAPLDDVVKPSDRLIISYEKNGFNGNRCYIPTHHLSDFHVFKSEKNNKLLEVHNDFKYVILNWLIISEPRHPIIERTIRNLVEILRSEFVQEPVMRSLNTEYGWAAIMCATGPSLLTASVREHCILNNINNETAPSVYTMAYLDFKSFGGKFKAVPKPVRNIPGHFMNLLHKKHVRLLSHYLPEQPVTPDMLKQWQGHPVQGQNGRQIFVVDQGQRRGIPNFDTFLALNFTMADVTVISDVKLSSIPIGESMPSLMKR